MLDANGAQENKSPGLKKDPAFDQASAQVFGAAKDELRSFVERVECLNCDKAEISQSIKEVFAEAKARGFDCAALKKVIALRKLDRDALAEHEAVVGLYRDALGF